jgi:hypothetical protein
MTDWILDTRAWWGLEIRCVYKWILVIRHACMSSSPFHTYDLSV